MRHNILWLAAALLTGCASAPQQRLSLVDEQIRRQNVEFTAEEQADRADKLSRTPPIGATMKQALAAWGHPYDIHTSKTANGQQWIGWAYPVLGVVLYFQDGALVAYFRDGVLTAHN